MTQVSTNPFLNEARGGACIRRIWNQVRLNGRVIIRKDSDKPALVN